MEFQTQFLTALQLLSLASFAVSSIFPSSVESSIEIGMHQMTSHEKLPDPERMSLNFKRRYKWLCYPRGANSEGLLFDLPSLPDFYQGIESLREVCVQ